jgi:hypothetical protein
VYKNYGIHIHFSKIRFIRRSLTKTNFKGALIAAVLCKFYTFHTKSGVENFPGFNNG